MTAKIGLFFLKTNEYFPEGTLFELSDDETVSLPDGGDGGAVFIDREHLLPCTEFAESVPPGQCPVTVTSLSEREMSGTVVDITLHYQVIEVPIAAEIEEILSVTVNDRFNGWQADSYESSAVEGKYRLHIGHLRPGFYEAIFELPDSKSLRMTFIKFFPKQFTDRYDNQAARSMASVVRLPSDAPHRSGEAYSDALLNLALELATEWGDNFRKPIHERIRLTHPELTDAEIDELAAIASKVESRIYALAEDEMAGKITEFDIVPTATGEFPWLSHSNAARLANIGMYYARR